METRKVHSLINRRKKRGTPKKKKLSAYNKFIRSASKNVSHSMSPKSRMRAMARQWRALSETKKRAYKSRR